MARTKKVYESKAVTTTIKVSSRASIKLGEKYYTIEYGEERNVPEDCDLKKERELLWDDCNNEVDIHIEEIIDMYKKSQRD